MQLSDCYKLKKQNNMERVRILYKFTIKEQIMEWISVKDRLPSNETQCIGYFNHRWQVDFRVNEVWFNEGKWYWDLDLIIYFFSIP